MSEQHIETIDGDAAEAIYKKYLQLVGKYTMQSKNHLFAIAYYKFNS